MSCTREASAAERLRSNGQTGGDLQETRTGRLLPDRGLASSIVASAATPFPGTIMPQRMALTSGTKLGPYEIQSPIGAGGMGEVYRARDTRLSRDVAIKILPASFSADPDRLQRFAQESRAAAALNHPNILSIYDIGEDRGAPYVVSELLEGESLRERLRPGALSSRKAIDYAQQIA